MPLLLRTDETKGIVRNHDILRAEAADMANL